MDVEQTIDYLKNKKGVKLNDMMKALNVDRGNFLSWRRSSNQARREDMAKKLREAFSELFEDAKEDVGIEKKYLDLLEKNLAEVSAERDELKKEVKRLLKELNDLILGK